MNQSRYPEISYRVSAGAYPGSSTPAQKGFQFWMEVKNITNKTKAPTRDISFVVCSMLNRLSSRAVSVSGRPSYSAGPSSSTPTKWIFTKTGTRSVQQNFHFSCDRVKNLAPGHTASVVDEKGFFKDKSGNRDDAKPGDLDTVYWDLLEDAPLSTSTSGNQVPPSAVHGPNKFLYPTGRALASNAWSGTARVAPEELKPVTWPVGNWITMSVPDSYEAVLRGTVLNAPANSQLTVRLGEQVERTFELTEGTNGFEIPYVIETGAHQTGSVQLVTDGEVEEGRVVGFRGRVFARSDTEIYEKGGYMHKIDINFIRDTEPPTLNQINIDPDPAQEDSIGPIRVEGIATDASSMPITALAIFRSEGEVITKIPLNIPQSDRASRLMEEKGAVLFKKAIENKEVIDRVEAGQRVTVQLRVADELGNSTRSDSFEVAQRLNIWPGDTNNDGQVGQEDVLPLGQNWNATGPARKKESCQWESRSIQPWSPEEATYADADGNGEVNQADVLCIGQNWGKTHSKSAGRALAANSSPQGTARLQRTSAPGAAVWYGLKVEGTASLMGASAKLSFPSERATVLSVEPGPVMGQDALFQSKVSEEKGTVAFGASRKGKAATGGGLVARIKLRVDQGPPENLKVSVEKATAGLASGELVPLKGTSAGLAVSKVGLSPPSPNPARSKTRVQYTLPEERKVRLTFYNVLGQEVKVIVSGRQAAGRHSATIDVSSLASGLYILRLRAEETVKTRTVTVVQ